MCIETLFSEFCDEYNLKNHWFFSQSGPKVTSLAVRNMFFYRAYLKGHKATDIGRPFGIDHSSVFHGIANHCVANGIPFPPKLPQSWAKRIGDNPERWAEIRRAIDMVIA